jgi:hypothetical protein
MGSHVITYAVQKATNSPSNKYLAKKYTKLGSSLEVRLAAQRPSFDVDQSLARLLRVQEE